MKKKFGFTLYSLTLVLVTICICQFVYPPPEKAYADPYACMKQKLNAKVHFGYVNKDKEFSIGYRPPACFAENGYHPRKAYFDGQYVFVSYENPNFK